MNLDFYKSYLINIQNEYYWFIVNYKKMHQMSRYNHNESQKDYFDRIKQKFYDEIERLEYIIFKLLTTKCYPCKWDKITK